MRYTLIFFMSLCLGFPVHARHDSSSLVIDTIIINVNGSINNMNIQKLNLKEFKKTEFSRLMINIDSTYMLNKAKKNKSQEGSLFKSAGVFYYNDSLGITVIVDCNKKALSSKYYPCKKGKITDIYFEKTEFSFPFKIYDGKDVVVLKLGESEFSEIKNSFSNIKSLGQGVYILDYLIMTFEEVDGKNVVISVGISNIPNEQVDKK